MKSCSDNLLSLISQPKTISARMTFRVERPRFATTPISNALNITDPSKIDCCEYGTGILRVTSYNNILYYQNVQDVYSTWPAWVNAGIALYAGSRPGVDAGCVWYQKSDDKIYWRSMSNWAVETVAQSTASGSAQRLAPISNKRCYRMSINTGYSRISWMNGNNLYGGTFYNVSRSNSNPACTFDSIDAVSYSSTVDYLYFSDRTSGHIIEVSVRTHNAASLQIDKFRPIVAMDAIDDVYGLKLHGASIINGNVVVTGRLTRTSDSDPVSMDVYLMGPESFTFGREMFISGAYVGGKMMLVGSNLVVPGMNHYADAVATNLFGVDNEALKLVTSDVGNLQLVEAESRSSTLRASLASSLSHDAISRGSSVVLEVAYNDEWMTVLTGEINRVLRSTGAGQELFVEIQNRTAKRLSQWSPEQGVYIPAQSYNIADADDLTQFIWTTSNLTTLTNDITGSIDHTSGRWVYNGTYTTDTYRHISSTSGAYAELSFRGTNCQFLYYKNSDRAIFDFYIDGILRQTIDCYAASASGVLWWDSGILDPGEHIFRVQRNASSAAGRNLVVFYMNITDNTSVAHKLTPKRFNDLTVMYAASRSTPGGLMRARFWNEPTNAATYRNPRFGVGVNYNRETRADAATRLGIDYNDVQDDQCGHNGIVAIYSRLEASNAPGITLYSWQNSVMTALTSWSVTLPTGAVWLQIRSVDNEILVSYRQDGSAAWTTLAAYVLQTATIPFDPEVGGHGCIVMEKKSIVTSTCYTLSTQDVTLGVVENGSFPDSGRLMIDDEIICYSAKKGYALVANPDFGVRFGETVKPDGAFTSGERIIVHDNNVQYFVGLFTSDNDSRLIGMAACPFTKSSDAAASKASNVFDRTFRIVGYDWSIPNMWKPSAAAKSAGWPVYMGDTNYGSWASFLGGNLEKGLYLTPSGAGIPVSDTEYDTAPYEHYVRLLPAMYLLQRGAVGTSIVTHGTSTVINYVPIELWVDRAEFFSTDEDITLGDALKRIIRLTGGGFGENTLVNGTAVTGTNLWGLVPFFTQPDFIADITIPANIPSSVKVGVVFRDSAPINMSMTDGRYVYLQGNTLYLAQFGDGLNMGPPIYGSIGTLESIQLPSLNTDRAGVMRISIQDDRVAVWLNHKLLHSFIVPEAPVDGYYAGFAVQNPSLVGVPDVSCRVSELCDLMADITVGVRGNGMSVISEMLDGRRVNFRCEPDGSLYFYKSNTDAGTLPDIVISDDKSEADEAISRVRLEGTRVAEIADFALLSDIGNLFETVNAKWADSVPGLVRDGQYYLGKARSSAVVHQMATVFHPALQPGDKATVNIAGQLTDICITSTHVAFGFNDDNFNIQAGLEASE
jgi:hypothetical protein